MSELNAEYGYLPANPNPSEMRTINRRDKAFEVFASYCEVAKSTNLSARGRVSVSADKPY